MFYKKESEFKDKGVGTLHLKKTPEGKTQMIIRADTNLGESIVPTDSFYIKHLKTSDFIT